MSNRLKKLKEDQERQKREQKIAKSFKESKSQTKIVERLCVMSEHDKMKQPLTGLLNGVYKLSPKIFCKEYLEGFKLLVQLQPWLNSVDTWKPKGKGRDTIFQSLVDHLISKYPVPKFLYKIFYKRRTDLNHGKIFKHLAQGNSLVQIDKTLLPTPLTKRMRADFLRLPAETVGLVEGIRTAQVMSFDGTPAILSAILSSSFGESFRGNEEFWTTVIQWFCNNPMLDKKHIGPLIDYVGHLRAQDENFSMKGRSPLALIRGMEEWHGTLAKIKAMKGLEFEPCGLEEGHFVTKDVLFGQKVERHWTIVEILTSKELAEEGRSLRHCVYSYAHSIANGQVSIWSLREDGARQITIEVRNATNSIVQIRGKCNRLPDAQEKSIIRRWANNNSLIMSSYGF